MKDGLNTLPNPQDYQELPNQFSLEQGRLQSQMNLLKNQFDYLKYQNDLRLRRMALVEENRALANELLFKAIKANKPNSVAKWLDAGVNIEDTNSDGKTPLFMAIEEGHYDVFNLLVLRSADIHRTVPIDVPQVCGLHQYSALHCALLYWKGDDKITRALLEKGVNPQAGSVEEVGTPLQFVLGSEYLYPFAKDSDSLNEGPKIVKLFIEKQGVSINDLNVIIANSWWCDTTLDMTKLCLEAGIEINSHDENGQPPLIEAVMNGEDAICKLLLSHGALVDFKDSTGHTALHYAVTGKVSEVSSWAKTGQGLDSWDSKPLPEIVLTLLKNGADPLLLDLNIQKELLAIPEIKKYYQNLSEKFSQVAPLMKICARSLLENKVTPEDIVNKIPSELLDFYKTRAQREQKTKAFRSLKDCAKNIEAHENDASIVKPGTFKG